MKTLYDLLGTLADDDAEDLRVAFRKAVKGAHPDLNPDDPDAALKFRQIVRANDLLSDGAQRAVYDHLLDLAQLEQETASKHAFAVVLDKIASGTMALVGAAAVTIGGYLLFIHISVASVVAWDKVENVRGPTEIASQALVELPNAGNKPAADAAPPAELASSARTSRGAGELTAVRDEGEQDPVNEADQSEPMFSVAYIDRKIIFYRPRKSDHPFGEIAPAKHIEKPSRGRPGPTVARARRVEPRVTPARLRRTAERDLSREGAFPFTP